MRRVRGVEVVGTSVGPKENKENALSLKQTHCKTSYHDICPEQNLRASSWSVFVSLWGGGGGGGEAGRAMNRGWKREKTDAKVFNSCSRVTGTEN